MIKVWWLCISLCIETEGVILQVAAPSMVRPQGFAVFNFCVVWEWILCDDNSPYSLNYYSQWYPYYIAYFAAATWNSNLHVVQWIAERHPELIVKANNANCTPFV
jgi:hypothetical protein